MLLLEVFPRTMLLLLELFPCCLMYVTTGAVLPALVVNDLQVDIPVTTTLLIGDTDLLRVTEETVLF